MDNFMSNEIETEIIDDEDSSTYLSISDLMSGLLMFFALLFITTLLQLAEKDAPKRKLIDEITQAIENKNIDVETDKETGDISIRDSILFEKGSTELKPAGKDFLRQFIPTYSGVIFSKPEFEKEINRVVIEGHTSSDGDDISNLKLSVLRSSSVSKFIFEEIKFPTKNALREKILAAGRGEVEADKKSDNPSDRKVIFRLRFSGDEFANKHHHNSDLGEKK